VISVPKGHYTPVFRTTVLTEPQPSSVSLPEASPLTDSNVGAASTLRTLPSRAKRIIPRQPIAAAAAVVLIAAATWFVKSRIDGGPPPRPIAVTSLPGSEEDPSLSPDGRFVAFSWGGLSADVNEDIWIKSVDGDATRNLTNTPDSDEHWPRWSPDGQWIAFSRALKDGPVVIKVSALGGVEETIATNAYHASWTPDSRGLVMRWWSAPDGHGYLVHHALDKGSRRTLTDSPAGFADVFPRVSPDGTMLAFIRSGGGRSAIFLTRMAGGTPTLLGEWASGMPIAGLEWMPDGRE